MDDKNLENKIDKLINAMELLVDAVERGKGDSGYMSNSRFARRIKDGGNDYLYTEWKDLTKSQIEDFKRLLEKERKAFKDHIDKLNEELADTNNPVTAERRKEIDKEIKKENERIKKHDKILNKPSAKKFQREYEERNNPVSNRNLREKWRDIKGTEEGKKYRDYKDFSTYKTNEAQYHQSSSERDDLRRRLANSGIGDTAFGRYGQRVLDRQQRAADLGNFANYLNHGGAQKFASAFGGGKAGAKVVAGLGKFSKYLGFASKMLGGPWVQAILIAIDALKMIGDAVGEWKKYTAEMIKFQMQEEQLQYENTKRIATLATESAVEDVKYNGDIQLKMMDVQSQNLLDAVALNNDQYVNAVQTALGPMMQGINATAYQAAENRIAAAAQYQRNLNVKEFREESQGRYEKMRGSEYRAAKASLAAEENIANVEYTTKSAENSLKREQYRGKNAWQSMVRSNDARQVSATVSQGGGEIQSNVDDNGGGRTINPVTGKAYGDVGRYDDNGIGTDATNVLRNTFMGSGLREGVQAKAMATLEYSNQVLRDTADWAKTDIENRFKLTNTELQYATDIADKQQEVSVEVRNKFVDAAETIEKTWLKLAQQEEQYLDKIDAATNNTGLSMGYTNQEQLHYFQKMLMTQVEEVASKFGKSAIEVAQAQQSYIESTGRNKTLGEHDYGQLFGLGTYLGDDNLAATYGSEMEIFNHGIAESVDMLDDVLKDVNKIGLNGRKYTKDLVNNMKLATSYNFKGGTKELMEMAKWAQQTRFNLNSLSNMIDKVQEGGIEGVITQSAGFQVLGGHAAINSDPLGMLRDAWADPQAYAKRMQDMTKGFGRFDAKTGEVRFNINESMLIAQMAKNQGRSFEELRQEIIQRNKATQIEKQISGYQQFDEDQKALIANNAEYKDGKWVVKMRDGNTKDVSQLSKTDLEELMPVDHNERMEEYMKEVVTALNKLTGEEIREKTNLANATFDDYYKNYEERQQEAYESFEKNHDKYIEEIQLGMAKATKAFSDYIKIFEDGNQNVDAARAKIESQANNIASALANTAAIINKANQRLGLSANGNRATTPITPTVTNISTPDTSADVHTHQSGSTRVNRYINVLPADDAITSGDGKPMLVSARQVTSVHDGTARVAKTDPNDTALFAKSGGPFDKLFDGIFGRVNTIYNHVVSNRFGGDVRSASTNPVSNVYDGSSLVSNRFGGDAKALPTEVQLTINGKIELTGQNGQTIDIMDTLKNNPMFVRQITEMIVLQMNNNTHGGRNEPFHNRFSG